MKNKRICPKCDSNDIVIIPGRFGAHGSNIPMSTFSAIKVTRYLCAECGYSEEWIDKKEDIERLKKKFKAQS